VLNNGFVVYVEGKIWSSACVDRTEDENSFDGLLHRKVRITVMECCINMFISLSVQSWPGGIGPSGQPFIKGMDKCSIDHWPIGFTE
jgi:hypothetical protein